MRRSGPAPTLDDAEVLTMEAVGEFLGYDQDMGIYHYFRREHPAWFPALLGVHRTTFARQAANLWAVKEQVWGRLLDRVPHDPALSCLDSVPTPVCRFGRAGAAPASAGRPPSAMIPAAGPRSMASATTCASTGRGWWPRSASLRPMSMTGIWRRSWSRAPPGEVLGDRNYWDPTLTAELEPAGIVLRAPFKKRATDPDPVGSRLIGRVRWRIETVASQFVERYHFKRIWARDAWHLTSRVLRKVLSHTLAVCLCLERGHPPSSSPVSWPNVTKPAHRVDSR